MNTTSIKFCPLALVLLISGCAAPEVCLDDCKLSLTLPERGGVLLAPEVSPLKLHVREGASVTVSVEGGPPGMETTVLSFEQAAFLSDEGKPRFTLTLSGDSGRDNDATAPRAGENEPGIIESTVLVRSYADGVCRSPKGCKYQIINIGNEHRPVRDPTIIIRR